MSVRFHSLKVADVRREIDDAVSVGFEVPAEAREAFRFLPGQHVTLRVEVDGEELRRNYSIFMAPHEDELRVAIKQVGGGRFSTWANRSLQAGATIDVMVPHGSFTWTFEPLRRATYVGFAAGSGVTPILSILKAALAEEPLSRFVLLYGNRGSGSIMFLEELAQLKDRFMDRLQVYHFLAEEEQEVGLFNGRLDRDKISEILRSLVDPSDIDAAFICGPGAMMDSVEASLTQAGVAPDRILIERFTVSGTPPQRTAALQELENRAAGLQMRVTLEGLTRVVAFDPERGNILDSALAAGLPAPYACKAGVCATCRARLTRGQVEMLVNSGLTEAEVKAGYVLTCQSIPQSDDVAIDYDA